jgi:uncharacterized protein YaiE (UPF0345 family)
MPSYVVPAEGPVYIREGKPASAFSRGDLLCLTSASSLSKVPALFGIDIVGVALADSTKSVQGKVTYAIPNADTIFWSTTTPGSAYTRGANVNFNVDAAAHQIANASSGTVLAVCVKGNADVPNQSVESRIQIQFIHNAGNLVYS